MCPLAKWVGVFLVRQNRLVYRSASLGKAITELVEDFQKLFSFKRAAIDGLQVNAIEAANITLRREQEEANVGLVLSIYDTRWRGTQPSSTHHCTRIEDSIEDLQLPDDLSDYDPLQPYLILLKLKREDVSKELAVLLKKACLASYRSRLEAREELIKHRITVPSPSRTHTEAWQAAHPDYSQHGITSIPQEELASHAPHQGQSW
jgi:hypothetical protein